MRGEREREEMRERRLWKNEERWLWEHPTPMFDVLVCVCTCEQSNGPFRLWAYFLRWTSYPLKMLSSFRGGPLKRPTSRN